MTKTAKRRDRMHRKWVLGGLALLVGAMVGCTPPIYSHTVTTKYDAQGNVIGMEETEGIVQQSPSTSPMKVNITKGPKLEK